MKKVLENVVIGIHPDRVGRESYSDKWAELLAARGVPVRALDLLAPSGLDAASACDGVMWRWLHIPQHKQSACQILRAIETGLGIPVFPDHRSAWHFDDKIAQYYLLSALGAPLPESFVFWNRADALAWSREARYPVVFKLKSGAGSANVLEVDNPARAQCLIRAMFDSGVFPYTMNEYGRSRVASSPKAFVRRAIHAGRYLLRGAIPPLPGAWWQPEKGYTLFQEFLPGNAGDTRIAVIGKRAFGFRRLNRPDDFRASGSGKIDHDREAIDRRCVEIAFQISQAGGFVCMSYDFLFRDGDPVVNEMSYGFADRAVSDCPGHWTRDLAWHDGQMWPEEAQLDVFLEAAVRAKQARHAKTGGG